MFKINFLISICTHCLCLFIKYHSKEFDFLFFMHLTSLEQRGRIAFLAGLAKTHPNAAREVCLPSLMQGHIGGSWLSQCVTDYICMAVFLIGCRMLHVIES